MRSMIRQNQRTMLFIILSTFLLNFGFQVWQTLFNNFAVEDLNAGPAAVGLIQAVREIPGLMGFVIGFLALFIAETRIMSLSVVLLGLGITLSGAATSIPFLLVTTLLMSFGFHFFSPCSSALILMLIKKRDTPKMLGNLGSLGSLAAVAGTAVVLLLAVKEGYRYLFYGVGIVVMFCGLLLLPFGGGHKGLPLGRKVILRRRYRLYYSLSFLLGCRRHIFTTFAIYLLVREYHVGIETTALLYFINSVINIFTLRITGQLVGRLGERIALSITFGSLALVFLGYAYVTVLPLLFVLFIVDNIFFGFNIALTTYFQKVAVTQQEITSNVSTEQTINHIAAIIVPIIGGTVWAVYGSKMPFLFGVGIVLIGLVLTQFIRTPEMAVAPAVTSD
jgi:predicted MFS family arabinose efflux permease